MAVHVQGPRGIAFAVRVGLLAIKNQIGRKSERLRAVRGPGVGQVLRARRALAVAADVVDLGLVDADVAGGFTTAQGR